MAAERALVRSHNTVWKNQELSFIDTLWYGKGLSAALLRVPLLPFSALFGLVTSVRRSLYTQGYLKSTGPVVPVVVVGGVTVGGTGKTPIVIALVNELTERGFNPGVLSRGYKAKCDVFPSQVPMDCDPEIFGDEPSLIRRSTGVPVVIDPVRTRGADYLAGLGVDVIITDDGLQHYALDREVEICVLDGTRMLGNGCLLPAGPLREGEWRLSSVNSIVVSGAVAHLGHNPMMLRPSAITALNPDNPKQLEERGEVTAFCGIGNPSRFYKTLEDCGFVVVKKVEVGDHNKMPFDKLRELASERTVIMTAKDAIKYRKEAKESSLDNVFVLNVAAQLSKHFFDDIVSKIKLSLHRVEQRRRRREEAGYVLQKVEGIEDYGIKADADYITKTAARLSAEMQNAELAKARLKAALRADKEGPVLPADDIEINPELNIDFSKQVSKDDDPPRKMEFEHQARADFVKRETVVVDAYRPGIGKSSSSKLDSKRDDDLDDQLNTKHDDQLQENAVATKHDDKIEENTVAAKLSDNVVDSKQDESVEAAKHDDKIEENVVETKSDANDDQVDAINANDAIESHQIADETDVAKSNTSQDNAKPSAVVESVEPKQDMYGPAAALMEKAANFYEHAETLRNIAEQAQDQKAATDTHKSEDQSVELTEAKADELSAVATAAEQNANSTNAAQEEQPQATAQDLIEESATANEDASYIPKTIYNYSAANVENEAIEKTFAKQETVEAKSEPKVEADKSKITATAEQAKSESLASEETAEVKVEPVVYDLWIPSIPSLFMLQESRSTVVLESKQEAQDLKQIEAVAAESKSAKEQDDATSKSVATDPALQDQAIDASLAKDAAAQDKSAKDSESKDAEAKSEAETDVQVAKEYKLWIPSIPVLPSYSATEALEASQTAATTTTTTKSKSTAKKATTKASAVDTAAKTSTAKESAADTATKASKATTAKASASGSAVKTSPGEAIAAAKGNTKKTATKSTASEGSAVSKTTTRRAPTRAVIASIDELPKSIRKKTTKATKDAAKSEAVLPLIDALDKSESTDSVNTLVAAAKKDDAISAVETTKSTTRTRKKASESKDADKSETTDAEASTATRKSTAKKTTTKSTSTSATKSTTTRKRTSTAAKSKAAEDATELSEDKVEVATSSKTTTKAKSTTAKTTKKTSKAESASDAEVTSKKSAKADSISTAKASAAAEGAADSEASTKKTTKASAKADAAKSDSAKAEIAKVDSAKAESAKADSDKAESASESESSAKSTAKRTVKRTTRSSAKDEKDIFALKKMRDVYDPNAVPTKLKRKTTTKSKSAEQLVFCMMKKPPLCKRLWGLFCI